MSELKSYRLTSMEEPTDLQLASVMARVGKMGRESTRNAQKVLEERMAEIQKFAESLKNKK